MVASLRVGMNKFFWFPKFSRLMWQGTELKGLARGVARLGTDYLDLYLLHWPNGITDLSGVVAAFENLHSKGKICAWHFNFNVSDMERLLNVPHGDSCATNQVPYSLSDRAVEHDLLLWCAQHAIPVMAYSPLGGASRSPLPRLAGSSMRGSRERTRFV